MSRLPTKDDPAHYRSKSLQNNKDSLLAIAPLAVAKLRALLQSGNERVSLDAAKAILDRSGLLPTADRESPSDANLAEIPVSELRRIADGLEREISGRAKVINAVVANKDGKN